jgi:hypothetical protein
VYEVVNKIESDCKVQVGFYNNTTISIKVDDKQREQLTTFYRVLCHVKEGTWPQLSIPVHTPVAKQRSSPSKNQAPAPTPTSPSKGKRGEKMLNAARAINQQKEKETQPRLKLDIAPTPKKPKLNVMNKPVPMAKPEKRISEENQDIAPTTKKHKPLPHTQYPHLDIDDVVEAEAADQV